MGQENKIRHKKLVFWNNGQHARDIEYCGVAISERFTG
jgi:hypothetical protein